jgi:AcrR family transcriptional regulator
VKSEPAGEPVAADPTVSWREQAVARSLVPARMRAEDRVQRFLDAALELVQEGASGKEFTVQEVVERSGQSLRSFYQYFGGKHELLLALFEESVRSTADELRDRVAEETAPLDRLHRFVVEYYRMCRPPRSGRSKSKLPMTQVMVDFAQQLMTAHPAEAARAYAPVVALFSEVLDDAAEAGVIRQGLRHGPVAGIVLEAIMFNAFSLTIGGTPARAAEGDPAEELWDLVFNGITAK